MGTDLVLAGFRNEGMYPQRVGRGAVPTWGCPAGPRVEELPFRPSPGAAQHLPGSPDGCMLSVIVKKAGLVKGNKSTLFFFLIVGSATQIKLYLEK